MYRYLTCCSPVSHPAALSLDIWAAYAIVKQQAWHCQWRVPRHCCFVLCTGALKLIIPDFKVPAIVLPNVSFPLFKAPADLKLPVFKLPGELALLIAMAVAVTLTCSCICVGCVRQLRTAALEVCRRPDACMLAACCNIHLSGYAAAA
jgi:hypothetical protein